MLKNQIKSLAKNQTTMSQPLPNMWYEMGPRKVHRGWRDSLFFFDTR